ncbi:DNA repair protein RecO [Patescibacteria group bacterium]
MRGITTDAFVIKNINLKDADKMFTILTPQKGKISALAKGVRKINSRRAGNLDTLNKISVQLNKSKGDMYYITEAKALKTYQNIKKDYTKIQKATYIIEFINKAIFGEEEAQEAFDLLEEVLDKLESNGVNSSLVINKFELKMLKYLGYEPPKSILLSWKGFVKEKKFEDADRVVKNFVREMIQEDFKSLEIQ